MSEGGQPPIVYHIENLENLNVAAGQNVTNIKKSSVGSVAIRSNSGEQRDEAFPQNDESGATESDAVFGSEHKDNEPEMNEADITWLQNGRFGMYIKKPLHSEEKVYRGVQKLMSNRKRDVAIKRLVYKEKKREEVDFLLKLQHPNIVQIIDAFDQRGEFHWIYIVMELCSQNLQEYIDENKPKPPYFEKLLSFSKQLVNGLAYLHQNKVIHRDLKPENVLISMCKNFIKLSDFGMSKEIQEHRSIATVTTIGAGSEGYKPPETYQTEPQISPRLDIFPLGLILHLLFTNGLHPFGSDPYDWSYNIRKNTNPDLSQIPEFEKPNDPKKRQLLDLLNRMLRHLPRDRPTVDEVKNDSFFKDLMQEGEYTIYDDVAALDISSPSTITPVLECSKDSKYSSQKEGMASDEQVAATNVSLPSASSPASQDTKPAKQEENPMYVNMPLVDFLASRADCKQIEDTTHSRLESSATTATTSVRLKDNKKDKVSKEAGKKVESKATDIVTSQDCGSMIDSPPPLPSPSENYHPSSLLPPQPSCSITRPRPSSPPPPPPPPSPSPPPPSPSPPPLPPRLYLDRTPPPPRLTRPPPPSTNEHINMHLFPYAKQPITRPRFRIPSMELLRLPLPPPPSNRKGSVKQPTPLTRLPLPIYESIDLPPPPPKSPMPAVSASLHPGEQVRRRASERQSQKGTLPDQVKKEIGLKKLSEATNNEPYVEVEDVGRIAGDRARALNQRQKANHERAAKLMEKRKFLEATEVLHKLCYNEGSMKLEVALKIAECEAYLKRDREQVSMQRVKDIISTSGMLSADLLPMANKSRENKNYVRSLVLLYVSHDLRKTEKNSRDDATKWISELELEISLNAEPLIQAGGVSRNIGIRYGLRYMERLLNELRSAKNVNPEDKALKEVGCLINISRICYFAGEYRKLMDFARDGVEIMDKQFGTDAYNYNHYATILGNLAVAYEKSGDNSNSKKYFATALDGFKKAKNITEDQRREMINKTTNNLKRVSKKI